MCLPWPLSIVFLYCPEVVVKMLHQAFYHSVIQYIYMYVIRSIISQPFHSHSLPPSNHFSTKFIYALNSLCWTIKLKTESNVDQKLRLSLLKKKQRQKKQIITIYWSNIVEIIESIAGALIVIKWILYWFFYFEWDVANKI